MRVLMAESSWGALGLLWRWVSRSLRGVGPGLLVAGLATKEGDSSSGVSRTALAFPFAFEYDELLGARREGLEASSSGCTRS